MGVIDGANILLPLTAWAEQVLSIGISRHFEQMS
jgi:hypothetical protein